MTNPKQHTKRYPKVPAGSNDLVTFSQSQLMQDICSKALSLADINTNVMIIGETGTGKKRLAHFIHENSSRANRPFYTFCCLDVDETIYRNAFRERLHVEDEQIVLKYDAIEKAERGILYLDHFSELSMEYMTDIIRSYIKSSNQLFRYDKASRPRLILSISQEKYHRVSGTEMWKNLLQQIDSVAIVLPPLRERQEDIPAYIDFFLKEFKKEHPEWHDLRISEEALLQCQDYKWPGNLRQLKNALFQGAVFSDGKTIEKGHLPFSMSWKLPYEFDGNKPNL